MNWTLHSVTLPVRAATTVGVEGGRRKGATTAVPTELATPTCNDRNRHDGMVDRATQRCRASVVALSDTTFPVHAPTDAGLATDD